MKSKTSKRIFAVLLAIIMLLSAVPFSVFASETEKSIRTCPLIDVHGLMSSTIYIDPKSDNSATAWAPEATSIIKTVVKVLPYLSKVAIDKNWDYFSDKIEPIVDELFEYACCDYNGEVTNGSGVKFEYPEKDEIKKDSVVYFVYDWRVDPLETADKLDDFVNYVLDAANCDQVAIRCHSFGGVVVTSYIAKHGSSKLKSVAFNTTAVYGETYTGELFTGNIKFDSQAIASFMNVALGSVESAKLKAEVVKLLEKSNLLEFVVKEGNTIVENIFDKLNVSVLKLFGNWTSIWSMVPDEYLDAAMKYVFEDTYAAKGIAADGLKQKVETYNEVVRSRKGDIIKNLAKDTNVYVLGRYGFSSIPITPAWDNMTDGNIDTRFNSFGATTSKYGKTLDIAEMNEYVSPDKTVDASTCILPEMTWFIKGLAHGNNPDCLLDMIDILLYHDGQATVDSFEQFPRFLEYKLQDKAEYLVPDGTVIPSKTLVQKIKELFEKLIARINEIFKFNLIPALY